MRGKAALANEKTPEERELRKKSEKVSKAKIALALAENALKRTTGTVEEALTSPTKTLDTDTEERLKKAVEAATAKTTKTLDDSVKFTPNKGPQTDYLAAPEDEVLFGGARGGGKALSLDTLFVTPTGLKKNRDLEVGDILCNPDGTTTEVLKIHPTFTAKPYKMVFSNGAEILACKDHQWYGSIHFDTEDPLVSWDNPRCVKSTEWIAENHNGNDSVFTVPLCNALSIVDISSSTEKRRELLDSLLGNLGTSNPQYRTVYNNLADRIIELASGLGFHATKSNIGSEVVVDIQLDTSVVTLNTIEKLEDEIEMRCITVDHPNELYMITGGAGQGYIATHNTYSLIVDPLRYVDNPNFKALLVRRTTLELRDIIRETGKLYPILFPTAKYLKSDRVWQFPSGAIIEMGYAETLDDAERYRGQQYTYIAIDEIGQHSTSEIYDLLIQSLRTSDPTLKTYMRCTANPGGRGSAWLKERFVDAAPYNTTFYRTTEYIHPVTMERREVKRSFKYIPATVFDNPYLMADETYVAALASLPEAQKQMMLYGNWDVVEDGSFPEFSRENHVVAPYELPRHLTRFCAIDWGYTTPFCALWFAVDDWGDIIVYREFYGKGLLADEFAREALRLEGDERIQYRLIDGSTTSSRGERGPTVHESIQEQGLFCGMADRSPNSRSMGKQEVHRRLALRPTGGLNEDGGPKMLAGVRIFNTCTNLIRTLPALVNDPNDPEKVLKKNQDDHCYDALRYGLSSRPIGHLELAQARIINSAEQFQPMDSTFGY